LQAPTPELARAPQAVAAGNGQEAVVLPSVRLLRNSGSRKQPTIDREFLLDHVGDLTVELQGYFRAADGYFAADHTTFWGCKIG
jgi:hypothetical protein